MRNWFKKPPPEPDPEPEPTPTQPLYPGDWVVMPFRIQEAARITLHTVSVHPEIPPHVQQWITNWLNAYNDHVSGWFHANYGETVFPVLKEISAMVWQVSEHENTRHENHSNV